MMDRRRWTSQALYPPPSNASGHVARCGGFYEWTRRGEEKQPWLFGLKDGGPFAFAGLWEHWTVPEGVTYTGSLAEWAPGEAIETCTILTTSANAARGAVHGRAAVWTRLDVAEQ